MWNCLKKKKKKNLALRPSVAISHLFPHVDNLQSSVCQCWPCLVRKPKAETSSEWKTPTLIQDDFDKSKGRARERNLSPKRFIGIFPDLSEFSLRRFHFGFPPPTTALSMSFKARESFHLSLCTNIIVDKGDKLEKHFPSCHPLGVVGIEIQFLQRK